MEEETKQEQGGTEPTAKTYTEAEYNALQEQLTAMQSQLSTANETIQSYKDMDSESIRVSDKAWAVRQNTWIARRYLRTARCKPVGGKESAI